MKKSRPKIKLSHQFELEDLGTH